MIGLQIYNSRRILYIFLHFISSLLKSNVIFTSLFKKFKHFLSAKISNSAIFWALSKSKAIYLILSSLLPYFCLNYCNSFYLFSSKKPSKNIVAIILNTKLMSANSKRKKMKQNTKHTVKNSNKSVLNFLTS
ncbi:hypothetical protein A5816_002112 [Enterococcus sp. 3G1_DIV0629]|nr:hypothetical protein A5816_002112 [Enterococcus sp. 3G1_DIV0629]